MCVYSLVTEHYTDKWRPFVQPDGTLSPNSIPFQNGNLTLVHPLTQAEIDQIRRDAEELKELLAKAREYDIRNNEPNCELESKRQTIKLIAAALGIDVSFV